MKLLIISIFVVVLFTLVPEVSYAKLTCLTSEAELRGPHNEGDFSRIGRVAGDVPRYHFRNKACSTIGRFGIELSLNTVVGQKWTTLNAIGNGTPTWLNSDVYVRDLTPHWYSDARVILGKGSQWDFSFTFRNSLFDKHVVADHFGLALRYDWLK